MHVCVCVMVRFGVYGYMRQMYKYASRTECRFPFFPSAMQCNAKKTKHTAPILEKTAYKNPEQTLLVQ